MRTAEARVHSLLPYPVCSPGLGWFGFLGLAWRTIVLSSVFSYRVCTPSRYFFSPTFWHRNSLHLCCTSSFFCRGRSLGDTIQSHSFKHCVYVDNSYIPISSLDFWLQNNFQLLISNLHTVSKAVSNLTCLK